MAWAQKILVVGGGGFIGQHVLAYLATGNVALAALDVYQPDGTPPRIDWIAGSANDEALLSSAVRGRDVVVFLAASSLPASANADMAAEIVSHVRMVVKAAEICTHQGVKTFVFASSGGTVYGISDKAFVSETERTQPLNAYGVSKAAIEQYLGIIGALRGMRTISLRISNPFGPGQRANRGQGFIAAAMSAAFTGDVLPCWGDGSTIRDFIYVEDVAAAFAKACAYEGESIVLNIASGEGRSLREVIVDVETTAGRALQVNYTAGRTIDVPRNVLDITRAAAVLGWRPSVAFREGLRRTALWWETSGLGG